MLGTKARSAWSKYFEVGGYDCRLLIYPKGDSQALPGYVSMYLQIIDPRNSKWDRTDPTKSIHRDSWHRFSSKKKSHGWCDFITSNSISDSKLGFMYGNDCLLVTADIMILNESVSFSRDNNEAAANSVAVVANGDVLSGKFTWKVHNFSLFKKMIKTQKIIMSPVFPAGECNLRISVYQSTVSGVDYLSMCLESKDTEKILGALDRSCWCLFRMSVLNQKPMLNHVHRDSYGNDCLLVTADIMILNESVSFSGDNNEATANSVVVVANGDVLCGKFTWKVHNFSLFKEMIKTQKIIMSPVFPAGERNLRISVYQSTVSGVDYLSMCLESKDTEKILGAPDMSCWCLFRMSVLNQKPGLNHVHRDSYGNDCLLVTADIMILNESVSFSGDNNEAAANSVVVVANGDVLCGKFTWIVHNFSLFKEMIKTQKIIMSPVFPAGERNLRISVYQSTVSGVDYLSMCLESKDTEKILGTPDRSCWCLFRMSVLNQKPGLNHVHRDTYGRFAADNKGGDNTSLGWNGYMKMADFVGDESGYLVDDMVVFSSSFHVIKGLNIFLPPKHNAVGIVNNIYDGHSGRFSWKIENFTRLKDLLKKRKITVLCIKSRRFQIGNRDCRLIVYPTVLFAKEWGWREFVTLTSLFDQDSGFLDKDLVHFYAEVLILKETSTYQEFTDEEDSDPEKLGRKCSFTWKVENFMSFKIFSKFFQAGGCELRIGVYESFDTICIYLESDQSLDKNFWVRYKMSIVNQKNPSRTVSKESSICTKTWNNSVLQFMKVSDMVEPDGGFLMRDTVVFVCDILDCCPWFEFSDLEVLAFEDDQDALTSDPDDSSEGIGGDEEEGFHLTYGDNPSQPQVTLREKLLMDVGAFGFCENPSVRSKTKWHEQFEELLGLIVNSLRALGEAVSQGCPVPKREPQSAQKIALGLEKAPKHLQPDLVVLVPKLVERSENPLAAFALLERLQKQDAEPSLRFPVFAALSQLECSSEVWERVLFQTLGLLADSNDAPLEATINFVFKAALHCQHLPQAVRAIRTRLNILGTEISLEAKEKTLVSQKLTESEAAYNRLKIPGPWNYNFMGAKISRCSDGNKSSKNGRNEQQSSTAQTSSSSSSSIQGSCSGSKFVAPHLRTTEEDAPALEEAKMPRNYSKLPPHWYNFAISRVKVLKVADQMVEKAHERVLVDGDEKYSDELYKGGVVLVDGICYPWIEARQELQRRRNNT